MRRREGEVVPVGSVIEGPDESDVAAGLIRTAFILAFALTPFLARNFRAPAQSSLFVQSMLVVAAAFNLALFGSYLWHQRLLLKRPLALAVDLLLVTAALDSFHGVMGAEWLVALYYLIIMMGAVWFRRTGAVVTALAASLLNGAVGMRLPLGWQALLYGQAPVMVLVGVMVSYIVMARDRERQALFRLEHEMMLARELQARMLPSQLPRVEGLEVGVSFRPARAVGGDLYDLIAPDPDRLVVCLGDMAGKSVYGLFHLSLVHSHLHAALLQGLAPAAAAEVINSSVYDALQPNSFAALFLAEVTASAGRLKFANCGHLPPLLFRAGSDAPPEELSSGGIVIGAKREPQYAEVRRDLLAGDTLVCFTDGLTEARGARGEEFGVERIVAAVRSQRGGGAEEIAEAVMAACQAFQRGPGADDCTVLVVKMTAEAGPRTETAADTAAEGSTGEIEGAGGEAR